MAVEEVFAEILKTFISPINPKGLSGYFSPGFIISLSYRVSHTSNHILTGLQWFENNLIDSDLAQAIKFIEIALLLKAALVCFDRLLASEIYQ